MHVHSSPTCTTPTHPVEQPDSQQELVLIVRLQHGHSDPEDLRDQCQLVFRPWLVQVFQGLGTARATQVGAAAFHICAAAIAVVSWDTARNKQTKKTMCELKNFKWMKNENNHS